MSSNRYEARKRQREERIAQGICPRCGKNKLAYGRKMCRECLDRANAIQKSRKPKIDKEKYNRQRRELYRKRKESGVCTVCGDPLYKGYSNVFCEYHYYAYIDAEEAAKKRKSMEKTKKKLIRTPIKKIDPPVPSLTDETEKPKKARRTVPDRWPYGWCYVCCQPTEDPKKKLCNKHKDWIYGKKRMEI